MAAVVDISKINRKKVDFVRKMVEVVQNYDIVKRLIIFGSAVTENCTDESDIDICADIAYREKGLKVYNLGVDLSRICDGNCDILFYDRLKGQIKDEVDKKGVVVYVAGESAR